MELRNSIEQRLVGKSQPIREQIKKISQFDYPVLITGETGVGKSLVAELIHGLSSRASKKFIQVNCSNISSELFESELFGHEKGSFTDAVSQKKGLLELADGGTVFLDEVGDLHLSNQAKLLSFMDRGKFRRLGVERKADNLLLCAQCPIRYICLNCHCFDEKVSLKHKNQAFCPFYDLDRGLNFELITKKYNFISKLDIK